LLFLFIILSTTINKISMGRGDKKTKKGKIFKGSFGKSRPVSAKVKAIKATAAKASAEKESK
jgi:30S ribosomal protein S31